MFPGFSDRLQKEMITLAEDSLKVKVIASPDRKYSAWIGDEYKRCLKHLRACSITIYLD